MIREIFSRLFGLIMLLFGLALLVGGIWAAITDRKWSYLGGSALGVFIGLHGIGRLFPGQPPPLAIETGDPIMTVAMEQAQREFTRFKAGLQEGKKEALVKYALETGYGEKEHVWAVAHSIDDGAVICTLASEPVGDVEVKTERTRVAKSDVEDWLLVDDQGTMEGGFTQIAMAKIYKRDKGYVPYSIRKSLNQFKDLNDPNLV